MRDVIWMKSSRDTLDKLMKISPNTFVRFPVLIGAFLLFLFGSLTLLFVINSYTHHITPDISAYLLQTRTFVQTLDRFSLSHDSKGIMLMLGLAPTVGIFGAKMVAAATAQLAAYIVCFACFYRLVRSYLSPLGAAVITLIGLCTVFSYLIWGGNARPEDFALGYTSLALLAAYLRTPKWLAVGGVMAALCLFTKTTLILAPSAILLAGCLFDYTSGSAHVDLKFSRLISGVVRNLLWVCAGFALTAGILVAWIALFDSLPLCYRQTIQWPAEYRHAKLPDFSSVFAALKLFRSCHLHYLFAASLLGLCYGWLKGLKRLAVLSAVFLLSEFVRVTFEGALWPYTLTGAVIPMLIGTTMFGVQRQASPYSTISRLLVPLCCLFYFLGVSVRAECKAFEFRILRHLPSPYEYLAAQMYATGYQSGDTIFVNGNDYQIFLLMGAPPPAPVLPRVFLEVSPQEQLATRHYYEVHNPEWVIIDERNFLEGSVVIPRLQTAKQQIVGNVDYAYHVVSSANDESIRVRNLTEESGVNLCPILPISAKYRAVLETGTLQVWRLIKGPTPSSGN